MNIVFMGSAEFGIPALKNLFESNHKIIGIVTTPPRQKGRGLKSSDSPIAVYAEQRGLGPLLFPENLKSEDFIQVLKNLNADLFVVVAFRILPPSVFMLPRLGTINIHASLLPYYRGPAPIHRAIEAGEKQTGITIFRIDEGIDTGNIILQKSIPIGNEETSPQLYDRLSNLGAQSLPEAIAILENGAGNLKTQNTALATAAPKLRKLEGKIDWNVSAQKIFNKIRAFKPFPGAYTFLDGKRLAVESAIAIDGCSQYDAGVLCAVHPDGFDVQCKQSILRIREVKPEGKKNMSAKAFMLGRKLALGTQFNLELVG